MSKIEIRNLVKRYGDATALNNVSLTIESGEFLVLLGPSGCGKTTLLRCLAGLETPDDGEIVIGDEIVFSSEKGILIPPGKRNLGMVFQSYALWPHMTVRDNVKFGLDVLKMPNAESHRRIDQVLADLGMAHLDQRYPSELSGGQQQRVALARLLATRPPVFLMDEPLSNLDARLRMDMRVELKRIQGATGATTVYVTHDQTEAMTMSTRVVVMKDGNIQQVSPPRQVYRQPENVFVAEFIGMPRINLVEMQRKSASRYGNGDIQLDLDWTPEPSNIVVGARPEDLTLSAGEGPGQPYDITAVLPNGPETIVQLTRGATAVIARVGHDTELKQGQTVHVSFDAEALNIYDASTGAMVRRPGDRDATPRTLTYAPTQGRKSNEAVSI
ncbi:ABC transporter ATP-binding protein [Nitratireductor soli]|uniref:ABC transporter ATP-binding protein n=1 Tax=Nitratireductor soli TaxID=1670619 RepID=UPI00065E6663|nr:ABC transporter ATP-binding protein [Nitratireductor soli]